MRHLLALTCTALVLTLGACSRLSSEQVNNAYVMTGGGNARTGQETILKYGCNACHTISGVPGARGLVGPPLDGVADRQYLAGELPNKPENMMKWIQHPHSVEPHTAMPEMGVSEQDSRDIAAYLYTLQGQR